jgi:hypothetical protein
MPNTPDHPERKRASSKFSKQLPNMWRGEIVYSGRRPRRFKRHINVIKNFELYGRILYDWSNWQVGSTPGIAEDQIS